jgi:hypothetical protein
MSENRRSFWSTVPGLVTGMAGLLTGIVGLITVLIQLNVIGGDKKSASSVTTVTTVPGSSTPSSFGSTGSAGGTGATPTTELGRITVAPPSLKLPTGQREATLTVTNDANTATITVQPPQFDGPDKAVFKTDAGCTNVRLDPKRSCTLKVLFTPSSGLKTYTATLVIKADGASAPVTVPVEASTLL